MLKITITYAYKIHQGAYLAYHKIFVSSVEKQQEMTKFDSPTARGRQYTTLTFYFSPLIPMTVDACLFSIFRQLVIVSRNKPQVVPNFRPESNERAKYTNTRTRENRRTRDTREMPKINFRNDIKRPHSPLPSSLRKLPNIDQNSSESVTY